MNTEDMKLEKIEGIYDIQILSPALFSGAELLLASILFIGLIAYLLWRSYYSRKGIAKRKIRKLQKSYYENDISEHDAIYQLCSYLQQGLKLKQLKADTVLPEKLTIHSNKWLAFKKNVSTLRYKTNSQHTLKLETIFTDSFFWLKVWP